VLRLLSSRLKIQRGFSTQRNVLFSATKSEGTENLNHSSYLRHQNIPPFTKDLFLGKFNKSILSYAEILDDESYLNLESNVTKVGEYLESKGDLIGKIDSTSKIHPDIFSTLKRFGMFGLTIPTEHNGAGMLYSEVARYYEELGVDLSLCNAISSNELLGYRALLKSADESMREKYLTRLADGEVTAAWCLAEEGSGSDPAGLTTTASLQEESYILSGKKVLVTNAQTSQLLTVVAKTEGSEDPTCFLVDRAEVEPESVKISDPLRLAGLRGLEVSSVEFINCKVPKCSVLGTVGGGLKIVQSLENQNKYLQTCALIKYLKNLLNETIVHCNGRMQFEKNLSEFSLVREQLARMAGKLYSLESVTYLTAGLADASQDPDIEVESVITRQFASEVSDYIVSGCLQLIGANVNLETSKYQKYLRDNLIIQGWQGSNNINKCFVALSCLMHLIRNKPELAEIRQPADGNFLKSFNFQLTNVKHKLNRVALTHNLYHSVSPGLQTSARRLEWCVHKIPFVAEQLLVHRGANIQVEENYLARIHDLVTEVYVMTAVLSRASRSLTLGLDNFELEATIAVNLSFESKQRVKQLCVETVLCSREESNRDEFLEKTADYVTRRGQYVAVHPLTKNSF